MKRILDACRQNFPNAYNQNEDLIKLRLRGKGSGFKEGPERRGKAHPA